MPLKIDLDIAAECKKFNLDPALVQSIRMAEGGTREALLKAVRCSVPECKDADEAVHITCRTVVRAMGDFLRGRLQLHCALREDLEVDMKYEFAKFFAARWAPIGAKNDPTDLNKNWEKNFLFYWRQK